MNSYSLSIQDEINDVGMNRPHVVILGAGASKAAFKTSDQHEKPLPVMDDLVEVVGLGPLLEKNNIEYKEKNFELIYGKLYEDRKYRNLIKEIEDSIHSYFSSMELPNYPTIYDHLVLSLRSKDLIATFNWDPFLFQAWSRIYNRPKQIYKFVDLPHIIFLHGNVAIGYCLKDRKKGACHGLVLSCSTVCRISGVTNRVRVLPAW